MAFLRWALAALVVQAAVFSVSLLARVILV